MGIAYVIDKPLAGRNSRLVGFSSGSASGTCKQQDRRGDMEQKSAAVVDRHVYLLEHVRSSLTCSVYSSLVARPGDTKQLYIKIISVFL